jgi:adenylate kinase
VSPPPGGATLPGLARRDGPAGHTRKADDVRVILLGPPGAGKGTQATAIAERFAIPHISTGDILRSNVRDDTPLGREAKRFMDAGELVPDEVIIGMVGERLAEPDAEAGFLFDGFPRTVPQAQALETLLAERETPLDVVLRLSVPQDEVVRRLTGRRTCAGCGRIYHLLFDPPAEPDRCDDCGGELRQRDDDTEAVVLNRLEVYRNQTEPLEHYYWERGLLRDVDAVGTPEQVGEHARQVLAEYRSA